MLQFEKLVADISLLAGGEGGGVCPGVVDGGVVEVVSQVLEGALARDDGLDVESEHGEHSESSILDLLGPQLSEGVGVLCEVQGVELASGVQGVLNLAEGSTINPVCLNGTHQHNLGSKDGKDGLGVDEAGVAEVVQAAGGEDLRASLKPDGLTELGAVLGKELGEDAPQSTEHGPPGVDDLKLTVPGEGLGVSGQTSSVPAVVTGELSLQVRGGVTGEGAQELNAVRAIELNHGGPGAIADLGDLLGGSNLAGEAAHQGGGGGGQSGSHCV